MVLSMWLSTSRFLTPNSARVQQTLLPGQQFLAPVMVHDGSADEWLLRLFQALL
ncbi:MAG: hypothetical protein JWR89_5213 [Tardiphaga sp.]|uniref:hypothetical protein n=1 Tax=Tardiphaga sp. TaxID=1926292 RepID=UPI002623EB93|nr:hypothetical protein [Tardiphaga sp.]MDB5505311.1 hypothetical protein [Tardiphaga sp.]